MAKEGGTRVGNFLRGVSGPVLGAVGSAATAIWGEKARRKGQREQRDHEMALAEYAYSKDLEMWHRQNEYNKPSSQMERFGEAGLNPHLVYGQGTPGQATQMPQYNAPRAEYDYKPMVDPMSMLQGYMNMNQQTVHIDQQKQSLQNEGVRWWLMQSERVNLFARNRILELEEQYLANTLNDRTQTANAEMLYKQAQKVIEQKRAEWASKGLNPNDATWIRLTAEMLQNFDVDPSAIAMLIGGLGVGGVAVKGGAKAIRARNLARLKRQNQTRVYKYPGRTYITR